MDKQFFIKRICIDEERPPFSGKLEEYFENYIHHYILVPNNIIIGQAGQIWLTMMIMPQGIYGGAEVELHPPQETTEDGITSFPVYIPLEAIYEYDTPVETLIEIYFRVFTEFFTTYFKEVSIEDIRQLKAMTDFDYLRSLPFPAPPEEQGYLGDEMVEGSNQH
jgi:hypothetical protein